MTTPQTKTTTKKKKKTSKNKTLLFVIVHSTQDSSEKAFTCFCIANWIFEWTEVWKLLLKHKIFLQYLHNTVASQCCRLQTVNDLLCYFCPNNITLQLINAKRKEMLLETRQSSENWIPLCLEAKGLKEFHTMLTQVQVCLKGRTILLSLLSLFSSLLFWPSPSQISVLYFPV